MRAAILAAVVAAVLSSCVTTDKPPPSANACFDGKEGLRTGDFVGGILERNDRLEFFVMSDEERSAFLTAYNSTPPVSSFNFDDIGFFSLSGHPMVMVVFSHNGCVWHTEEVPRGLFPGFQKTGA